MPISNWEDWNDQLDVVELYATAAVSRGEFLGQPVLSLVQLARHLQATLVTADVAFAAADTAIDVRLDALEGA